MKGRVLFVPFVDRQEVSSYLQQGLQKDRYGVIRLGKGSPNSTILLLTSQNEGIPLTILEAAARQVRTVAFNVGALAELQSIIGSDLLHLTLDNQPEILALTVGQVIDTVLPASIPETFKELFMENFYHTLEEEFIRLIHN